jgi:hypothetical protein
MIVLGDDVSPDKHHPQQDHILYRTLSNTNTKAAEASLLSRHVHPGLNLLRHIHFIVRDLPKSNFLTTMQISMLH